MEDVIVSTETSLRSYFKTISRKPMLTQEQEAGLSALAREGDHEAKKRLVESNLLFVVRIAREYMNQGMPLCDLIQEGNLGLMHALEKFDERMGFRLTTYASWWIRLSIKRSVEQKSRQIRLPANKVEVLRKAKGYENAFMKQHGRKPTIEETAEGLGMPRKKVERVLQLEAHVTSFDVPINEEGLSYEQLLSHDGGEQPERTIHHEQMKQKLDKAMQVLSSKEKHVLSMRYGLQSEGTSASLREVGKRMGLSPEGVRRIENKALSKLRRPHVRAYMENFV